MSFVLNRNVFLGTILAISLIQIPCFAEGENLSFLPLLLSKQYGTVVSAGQIWLDRNIGASRVADST